jgi:transposase InsO family protein
MRRDVMPWKESSAYSEQKLFIDTWRTGEETFSELCRRFGISRKTGYKRVNRYKECGYEGLGDRSSAPHTHPNATSPEIARQLIEEKRAHPTWGPKKLIAALGAEYPDAPWPAPSTAGAILDRAGLIKRRRRRRQTAPWSDPFTEAVHANDVWAMDFKGWFRTRDGNRVDPLTVQDASSRFLLACVSPDQPGTYQVRRVLGRIFREYGLPRVIRTDNGPPFASVGLGGLTTLSVWCIKLGIIPERIQPGHPEQNGRLERLHRTLKAETATPPRSSPRSQQKAFDSFRHSYNRKRPHEALGLRPPALFYQPSPREYPTRVSSPQYHSHVTVRKVRTNGQIKWKGHLVYLSEALKGEPIGLLQQSPRYWDIIYGPLYIGLLDDYSHKVVHTPAKMLPMSPVYLLPTSPVAQ